MNDNFDIEEVLKRFRHEPDEKTKQSVLSSFRRAHASSGSHRPTAGFWRRPVPLYLAAAAILVLGVLSFVVGQRTRRADGRSAISGGLYQENGLVGSEEIKWIPAENDLL